MHSPASSCFRWRWYRDKPQIMFASGWTFVSYFTEFTIIVACHPIIRSLSCHPSSIMFAPKVSILIQQCHCRLRIINCCSLALVLLWTLNSILKMWKDIVMTDFDTHWFCNKVCSAYCCSRFTDDDDNTDFFQSVQFTT